MARNRSVDIDNEDEDLIGGEEVAGVGHNRPPREAKVVMDGNQSAEQLRSIVERIERLEEERQNITADIRDVYYEAKGNGYCPKTIRKIIKLRKMDTHERDEEEYTLDLYKRALGLIAEAAYD